MLGILIKRVSTYTIVLFLALILSQACSRQGGGSLDEKSNDAFKKGQRFLKERNYDRAFVLFSKVIDSQRDAPESHLELGRIYLDHKEDPLAAIYHFRKYLEARPNVEQSPIVRQMIQTAKKKFARSLPGQFDASEELANSLERLQSENLKLRRKLATLGTRVSHSSASRPTFAPVSRRVVEAPKIYTIVGGDTLSKISHKVYGTSILWEKIFNANRDTLKSPHDLKVGRVLRIPSREA